MHAALDGELDAAGMVAFERALADDPEFAKEFHRQQALRRVMRETFAGEVAPAALRARVEASVRPAPAVSRRHALSRAATFALGVGLGAAAILLSASERRTADLTDALVAGHRRSLLAASPVDIASNDRHAVRPWFDARIAISPPTPELAAFPLVGGRVDVIQGAPAPTLVYRTKEHYISVTFLPAAAAGSTATAPEGFHVAVWQGRDFVAWAISDADPSRLDEFARTFKAAEAGAPALR